MTDDELRSAECREFGPEGNEAVASLVAEVRRLRDDNERLREQRHALNEAIRLWGHTGRTDHLTEAVQPDEP